MKWPVKEDGVTDWDGKQSWEEKYCYFYSEPVDTKNDILDTS